LRAEQGLRLFEARDLFLQAIEEPAPAVGSVEHAVWFLYLNGFHDRNTLRLMKALQPRATDPSAVARAIRHLEAKLGLKAPEPRTAPTVTEPADRSSPQGRLDVARQLFWNGSPAEARVALGKLITDFPRRPALYWELAKVHEAEGDYAKATEALDAGLAIRPDEPELILAKARIEALLGHCSKVAELLERVDCIDSERIELTHAMAHHYSGQFVPAAREYRKVLATNPHHEQAAHGLAECNLRNNDIPGAHAILRDWSALPTRLDWSQRNALDRELTSPSLMLGGSLMDNSLDYRSWTIASEFQMQPRDELQLTLGVAHDWFEQDGFSSIERDSAQLTLTYQDSDFWSLTGRIGMSDSTRDSANLTGGIGVMLRPASTLELRLEAYRIDVVDSEPAMGISLYDLASTIGAVGGNSSMNALAASATWQPRERVEVFGKYRIAELSGDNTLQDAYASISYQFESVPELRIGYGVAWMNTEDPAPLYADGLNLTPYYYDPSNQWIHNLYLEYNREATDRLSYGAELHLYLHPESEGVGTGVFAKIQYQLSENQAIRLDARYMTQNRGRNRNNTNSGHYHALNLVAIYEYRF